MSTSMFLHQHRGHSKISDESKKLVLFVYYRFVKPCILKHIHKLKANLLINRKIWWIFPVWCLMKNWITLLHQFLLSVAAFSNWFSLVNRQLALLSSRSPYFPLSNSMLTKEIWLKVVLSWSLYLETEWI